jgi:hypothetical protein
LFPTIARRAEIDRDGSDGDPGGPQGRIPISSTALKEALMTIAAYFHPRDMTLVQFKEIHARLIAAGEEPNPHRLHHSCFGEDGDLMVYDLWDSPESFEAFGKVLMPILADLGVDPGEPAVLTVHTVLQSAHEE